MESAISPRSTGTKPLDRALQSLRGLITRGEWAVGTKLPGEWDLANRLGSTRGTVRNALTELTRQGLIREIDNGGGRITGRVVAKTTAGTGLASRTVVLLTDLERSLQDAGNEYGGHGEYAIDASVGPAVHLAGLHFMVARVSSLTSFEVEELAASSPAGVLATELFSHSPGAAEVIERLASVNIPVVGYGSRLATAPIDRICSDHATGAEWLTRFLIERGCRRIVPFGATPDTYSWVVERRVGYERAMRAAGLQPMVSVHAPSILINDAVEENFRLRVNFAVGFIAPLVLGAEPVDGILAQNDWDASVVCGALRVLGKVPNRDVAVVGYDDIWDNKERKWEPARPLATVDKQNSLIGQEMVRMLVDRIHGRLEAGPQMRYVEPKLVVVDQPNDKSPALNG